jgi:hypothetical protein
MLPSTGEARCLEHSNKGLRVLVCKHESNTGGPFMHIRQTAAALALALSAAATAAHADTIYTVTAAYDPFITGNTSFTIDNLSGSTLTGVDIVSAGVTKALASIAANSKETYTFDDQLGGPFIQAPGEKGLSDTTTYQVSAGYLGQTLTTTGFSPVSNLTGQYVDFLGACYVAQIGCSVDSSLNYPTAGEVAQGVTPVPLPPALALFVSGLLPFFGRLVRRA